MDTAIANCAAAIACRQGKVEHARIALNAVGGTPYRAVEAEAFLKGKAIAEDVAAEAAEKVKVAPEVGAYKAYLAKVLAKRAILACK